MRLCGAAIGVVAILFLVLVGGMRGKLPPILDAVRRFNRAVTNPRVLRSAGSAQARTSVIHHIGRTTGRTYQTPVDAIPTATGFLIALPYGTRADWLRNVLAARAATLVTDGDRVNVDRPTVVATADVVDVIPSRTLRTLRLFGVNECLRLERA